jgi:hypothetical protein
MKSTCLSTLNEMVRYVRLKSLREDILSKRPQHQRVRGEKMRGGGRHQRLDGVRIRY